MNKLIDTHAHLDELEALGPALEEAEENGVVAIVAVGSNHQSNERILEISRQYCSFVYPALGLHPWQLAHLEPSQVHDTLLFIERNVAAAVAIGEIGLDYDKRLLKGASKELQKEILRQLLALARKYDKPAIIHSRYAWKDSFQLVAEAGLRSAVFHWFTGFSSVLRDIIGAGYFISATPATEYHEEHRRAVREAACDSLLLETDSPVAYGRETKYESRPVDVLRSLRAVANLKGVDEAVVAEQTTKNAISFFSLDAGI
ncbi:MAG: TatD family hydrolase [Chloroflexota bacterium]|nr:TatD family hydrolase [Chloroflexota bacterium]